MTKQLVALVTGGSRGIGSAVCEALARKGMSVAVVGRSVDAASSVAASLPSLHNAKHHGFGCDVAHAASIKELFHSFRAEYGSIDVLVNCAGLTQTKLFMKTTDSDIDALLGVNLRGTMLMCHAALPIMLRQSSGGSIVNIGSVVGSAGRAGVAAYAASKAGIVGFSKSLAKEVGPRGIRVNVVEPGFITTDMTADMSPDDLKHITSQTALRKLGRPADVASAVAYLCCDEASFITGSVLAVDGGLEL